MLKINILSVTEDPREFLAEIPPQELSWEEDVRLAGPVKLSCEIYRTGQKVFIRGQFEASLELTCSRCLRVFQAPVRGALDLLALPAESLHPAEPRRPERELQEEDVALMSYTGDQLDLLPEVRTALVLSLPMKPLCEENCPGLCPNCGNRLDAQGHCHCGQIKPRGPFAALEKFREHPPSEN